MKKLVTLVLALVIMVLSACGGKESNADVNSLYAQGLEIVQLMSEMTHTEGYVDIHTGDSKVKAIIQDISTGDYSSPKAVYAISISDENLATMAELDSLKNASEELKAFLMSRVLGPLMTRINGMSSVETLVASSVCTAGKTFVNENAADSVIYLYTYENALPVAVTFTVGEDHAVSASGVFVLHDKFTCGSADEIKAFFSDIIVEVTEVQPEK